MADGGWRMAEGQMATNDETIEAGRSFKKATRGDQSERDGSECLGPAAGPSVLVGGGELPEGSRGGQESTELPRAFVLSTSATRLVSWHAVTVGRPRWLWRSSVQPWVGRPSGPSSVSSAYFDSGQNPESARVRQSWLKPKK